MAESNGNGRDSKSSGCGGDDTLNANVGAAAMVTAVIMAVVSIRLKWLPSASATNEGLGACFKTILSDLFLVLLGALLCSLWSSPSPSPPKPPCSPSQTADECLADAPGLEKKGERKRVQLALRKKEECFSTYSKEELNLQLIQIKKEAARVESELKKILRLDKIHKNLEENSENGHKVRILMEGAFDLMHYGHVNAFRLGRSLGHQLIVGVNSSETITKCKGPPVMTDEERCTMVRSCRFVDEIIEGIPYVMTDNYLRTLMEKHRIDYVVHGDDPVIVDGKDVYAHVKKMGKYLSIPRTEGVSTTDIVGRMLLCNSQTLDRVPASRFMKTSSILSQFRGGMSDPAPDAKIVYIDGDWDVMNARHIKLLKRARDTGDYLIVGVHNDELVASKSISRGNFPIMDLHERVLSVMGCRHVGDVLLDAPWTVSSDVIKALRISVVVKGTRYFDDKEDEEDGRYSVSQSLIPHLSLFHL